ncbi:MAG: DUF3368 domain-containing protein [Candidatus Diapherotrites archaeon]
MVVVDSSVIIHLARVGRLLLLKECFGAIIISKGVYSETAEAPDKIFGKTEIRKACGEWIKIADAGDKKSVEKILESEQIEPTDAELLVIAKEQKDILLTNDFLLVQVARAAGVECYWPTTFALKCVKKKIISRAEAKELLFQLINAGMRLKIEVYAAILKKIDEV